MGVVSVSIPMPVHEPYMLFGYWSKVFVRHDHDFAAPMWSLVAQVAVNALVVAPRFFANFGGGSVHLDRGDCVQHGGRGKNTDLAEPRSVARRSVPPAG